MPKIKFFIQQSWLLIVSSFFFGLLIAGANAAWEDKIEYNLKVYKFNKAAFKIFPDADHFDITIDQVQVKSSTGKKLITSVRKVVAKDGTCMGWAFICIGSGYGGEIKIILAVDDKFETIKGYGVLAANETPNIGEKIKYPEFKDQFVGAPALEFNLVKAGDKKAIDSEIVAITSATISSQAVVDSFNIFIPQVKKQMRAEGLIGDGK
ncbi:MAG: FMN-binding protein [Sedimentisphaerales bacterium]|nr:FMN-binding protein [Sedimentisphaerales bacterium]